MLGHALRELDGTVRDVWWGLTCFVDPAARRLREEARQTTARDASHRDQVEFLSRRWGLDERQTVTWIEWGRRAPSLAHRSRIGSSRRLTAEEATLVDETLLLFSRIATAAESTYGDAILRAAGLLETGPTKEVARVLGHQFPHHPPLRSWFLAQVDHSGWLRPLSKAGLLTEAEPMRRQSDGCWVAPTSPGARTTARLVREVTADDLLHELADHWLAIPNPRLHTDVVQVLIEAPTPIYPAHVAQLCRWLDQSPPHSWITRLVGDVGILRFPSHCLRRASRALADDRTTIGNQLIEATAQAMAADTNDRESFLERANLAVLGAEHQLDPGAARRVKGAIRRTARSLRR